jgi:hypothetical protein
MTMKDTIGWAIAILLLVAGTLWWILDPTWCFLPWGCF